MQSEGRLASLHQAKPLNKSLSGSMGWRRVLLLGIQRLTQRRTSGANANNKESGSNIWRTGQVRLPLPRSGLSPVRSRPRPKHEQGID
jgi:hypothetical protein